MKQVPNVTLGMLTFNFGDGHLPDTLSSILNQTYTNFNLIICDDHSSDYLYKKIEELCHGNSKIKIFRLEKRSGYSEVSNYLLKLAPINTDYFAWVSDHDVYHADWLLELVSRLEFCQDSLVAYPIISGIDWRGLINGRTATYYDNTKSNKIEQIKSFHSQTRGSGNIIYGLFRYKLLQKIGGWPKLITPDVLLLSQGIAFGSIAQVDLVLFYRRDQITRVSSISVVQRQKNGLFPLKRPFYSYLHYKLVNSIYLFYSGLKQAKSEPRMALYLFISCYYYICNQFPLSIGAFMSKLLIRIKSTVRKLMTPLLDKAFRFSFDNVLTNNNLACIEEKEFAIAYSSAVKTIGSDLDIPMRIHQIIWCFCASAKIPGDFVELGCGAGFSFFATLKYLQNKNLLPKNKQIYLFDTFLPVKPDVKSGEQVLTKGSVKPMAYADSFNNVQDRFKEWPNVTLISGKLPKSLEGINSLEQIAFIHVDLNHHLAEINSLKVLWNKISEGGIILLDDYANPGRENQRFAHEVFFRSHNLEILTLLSGQGLVIKR
jgi:glycosyltransferase involved in cell wall biosynthesis